MATRSKSPGSTIHVLFVAPNIRIIRLSTYAPNISKSFNSDPRLIFRRLPQFTTPSNNASFDGYYEFCYNKMQLFDMYENYTRVIFMDADALIVRPLQHLFTMDIGKLVVRFDIMVFT